MAPPTLDRAPAPALDPALDELLKCVASSAYFIHAYCQIEEAAPVGHWIPFLLWPAQLDVLDALDTGDHLAILKARQLGLTWLILCWILWRMLFRPATTALLFSRGEAEAWHLLERLRGIFTHLPAWLQALAGDTTVTDNNGHWEWSTGSNARAFSTNGGDSYTASLAFCDEADLVPDQAGLLTSVQPTIDGGGQMILLSRVDKDRPKTPFKARYIAARDGQLPGWRALFLAWWIRPNRTKAWYAARRAEAEATPKGLDDLQAQYPASDAEALAARSQNKRLLRLWMQVAYRAQDPLPDPAGAPALPELWIYRLPVVTRTYVCGADTAEGNPTSDDSAAVWVDAVTGEEVAALIGKFEPGVFAGNIAAVCLYFNRAGVLVERNNHGHAVIAALQPLSFKAPLLTGPDGKAGYLTLAHTKVAAYDQVADVLQNANAIIHSWMVYDQLQSIESSTLKAPKDLPDDAAMGFVLAQVGRSCKPTTGRIFSPAELAGGARNG